jgi:hypothetical protein
MSQIKNPWQKSIATGHTPKEQKPTEGSDAAEKNQWRPNLTVPQTEEKTWLLKQQNQGAQLHRRTKNDQQNRRWAKRKIKSRIKNRLASHTEPDQIQSKHKGKMNSTDKI